MSCWLLCFVLSCTVVHRIICVRVVRCGLCCVGLVWRGVVRLGVAYVRCGVCDWFSVDWRCVLYLCWSVSSFCVVCFVWCSVLWVVVIFEVLCYVCCIAMWFGVCVCDACLVRIDLFGLCCGVLFAVVLCVMLCLLCVCVLLILLWGVVCCCDVMWCLSLFSFVCV